MRPTLNDIAVAYEIVQSFRADHGQGHGLLKLVAAEFGLSTPALKSRFRRLERKGIPQRERKRAAPMVTSATQELAAHFKRHPAEYERFGGEHSN